MEKIHPVKFSGKNIPVAIAAKIMGKHEQFVRNGLIEGTLPIGIAIRKEGNSKYDFYISPKLLYDLTGFYFDDDLVEEEKIETTEK